MTAGCDSFNGIASRQAFPIVLVVLSPSRESPSPWAGSNLQGAPESRTHGFPRRRWRESRSGILSTKVSGPSPAGNPTDGHDHPHDSRLPDPWRTGSWGDGMASIPRALCDLTQMKKDFEHIQDDARGDWTSAFEDSVVRTEGNRKLGTPCAEDECRRQWAKPWDVLRGYPGKDHADDTRPIYARSRGSIHRTTSSSTCSRPRSLSGS